MEGWGPINKSAILLFKRLLYPVYFGQLMGTCPSKDKSADPCKPNPCKHDGYCVQVGQTGFRCLCQQTGYYGQHCHERCPSSEEVSKVFKTMWKSNNRKLMRKLLPCVLF
ncbi:predicted protein [Nematostella vectensis]|uniref:EGF-like domain-containing protein n=1 Tax=Nematostella vectensis TaxID=45351 RepID=A7RNC6_NEMVE|nr:predicted protein [Nematostella vectensis]|eukprot:XP_001639103.1 predicted protein [Nematostella vectensis]